MAIARFSTALLVSTQNESVVFATHVTDAATENVQIVGTVVMEGGSGTGRVLGEIVWPAQYEATRRVGVARV